MMNKKLRELERRYLSIGRLKGNGLLFTQAEALNYLNDLNEVGVGVVGVELWYYRDIAGEKALVEDPYGPSYDKREGEPASEFATRSIVAARYYVENQLPARVAFVSFVLDTDEPYWEVYKEANQPAARS